MGGFGIHTTVGASFCCASRLRLRQQETWSIRRSLGDNINILHLHIISLKGTQEIPAMPLTVFLYWQLIYEAHGFMAGISLFGDLHPSTFKKSLAMAIV